MYIKTNKLFKVKEVFNIQLTLSEEEAIILYNLSGCVGGSPNNLGRAVTDKIRKNLGPLLNIQWPEDRYFTTCQSLDK
jgi:hypothetical protein